jgi:hypothetical protein
VSEPRRKNRGVVDVAEARQTRSDPLGNRMVSFAVPADDLFGLLFEMIQVKHGRPPEFLGRHCPFGI